MSSFEHLFAHNQPPDTPVSISLTQEQLNELAAAYFANNPGLPFHGAQVRLNEGTVGLTARASFSGLPINVEITGVPAVEGGSVRFSIERVIMNGAPAPGFIADQIQSAINTQFGEADLPIHVEAVEVVPGEARIAGRTK